MGTDPGGGRWGLNGGRETSGNQEGLSFMFILFPFTRLVIPFTQLWSNFFSNSTFYTDMKSSATYTDLSLL